MIGRAIVYDIPGKREKAISWTGIVRLPGCYPLVLSFSTGHWHRGGTKHGPQSNPRLFTARLVQLAGFKEVEPGKWQHAPMAAWRLWLYFRGGYAFHGDLHIDHRPVANGEG